MKQYILSVCIATYNRCEAILSNVKELLEIKSTDFNIVVTDNDSTDNTVKCLKEIKDPRVLIFKNEKNEGAAQNWYHSLDNGNGKYILELNDKDIIVPESLLELIEILKKEEEFVCGYAYSDNVINEKKVVRLAKGMESIYRLGCWTPHTTGCIFNKKAWNRVPNIQQYFDVDKYGSGPQCAVFSVMGQLGEEVEFYLGLYCAGKSRVDYLTDKSKVFQGKYTFHLTVQYQINTFSNIMNLILTLGLKEDQNLKCFEKLCQRALRLSTIKAKAFLDDPVRRRHYNIDRTMSSSKLIVNHFVFFRGILEYILKHNLPPRSVLILVKIVGYNFKELFSSVNLSVIRKVDI